MRYFTLTALLLIVAAFIVPSASAQTPYCSVFVTNVTNCPPPLNDCQGQICFNN